MGRLIKLTFIATALFASACTEEQKTECVDADFYYVTTHVKFAPSVFEDVEGLPPIRQFDEAAIAFVDQEGSAPGDWQYTETASCRPRFQFQQQGSHFFGVTLHPDATFSITRRMELPSYVCAWILVPSGFEYFPRGPNLAMALTSNCQPVPAEYQGRTVAEAFEFLPNQETPIAQEIELVIDTPVAYNGFSNLSPFYDAIYGN